MSTNQDAHQASRSTPIDIARAIAVFGVILIHCAPDSYVAGRITAFLLNFCVPFFLLSSLYFYWREVDRGAAPSYAVQRRLLRLLIPYASWTVIYMVARAIKIEVTGRSLPELFSGPNLIAVVGAGGGAVHLYFLPLLAIGYVIAAAVAQWLNFERLSLGITGTLAAASTALLFVNVNAAAYGIPHPFVGLLVQYGDWMIWLVPFVFGAALLARSLQASRFRPGAAIGCFAIFGLIDLGITLQWFPYAWRFHGFVFAVLILGGCVCLSDACVPDGVVKVTRTFFGVYLVHHLVIELIEWIDHGRYTRPYSVASLMTVGVMSYALSVAFTLWANTRPRLAFLLLGQKANVA